jgi:eukaryotic-like serine/threonine-protein kinase
VCEAVHHAHRRLVLHRDVNPGNIIVTATREVKRLDFGIAKIFTHAEPDAAVDLMRTDGRRMTPAYASPEWLRGDVLTTARDVYALGLIIL